MTTAASPLAMLDRARIEPPTARGRATRARLLEAAEACFAADGFEGATVAAMAAKAGVSHGNFYRHFDGKDDILLAVVARLYGDLREASGGTGRSAKPSLAGLTRRNTAFFRHYADHRHLFRVTREAAARPAAGPFREMWLAIRGLFVERSARWIARCQSEGCVDPALPAGGVAAALGAMTEQMAYIELGLAADEPTDAIIAELGRTSGLIWYRALVGPA